MTTGTIARPTITKTLERVTFKGADDSGLVEAVFSTLNVKDKDGDVTLPGAMGRGEAVAISAYGHRSWDGVPPVGTGTIHEEGDEVILRGAYFMHIPAAAADYQTVKAMSEAGLQEWSYSLRNVSSHRGELAGEPVNFIDAVTVNEVSPVLVGAGVNTRTLAMKDGVAGLRFSEHILAVMAEVDELTKRATDVLALRSAKGKSFAPVSAAAIDQLVEAVNRLKGLTPPPADNDHHEDPIVEEALGQYVRFLAITNGATS